MPKLTAIDAVKLPTRSPILQPVDAIPRPIPVAAVLARPKRVARAIPPAGHGTTVPAV